MLGPGFEYSTYDLGPDPDGETDIVATAIRYCPAEPASPQYQQWQQRPALLWVHGMTDYFFGAHIAEYFHQQGYAFYAIDLRKCGRSHRSGQRWHYISDLSWYGEELSAVATMIAQHHSSITPIAHSTAGIIVPVWLDEIRRTQPHLHSAINTLILNSAWLGMMKLSDLTVTLLSPVIHALARVCPHLPFPGGKLSTFGDSIHSSRYGEFDFDTTFKPLAGHKKYLGWLSSVLRYQAKIQRGDINVGVPVLSLRSVYSRLSQPYAPAADTADVVIDTEQTATWAPKLSSQVTDVPILGARHEVFLSLAPAREIAFARSTEWLDEHTGRE